MASANSSQHIQYLTNDDTTDERETSVEQVSGRTGPIAHAKNWHNYYGRIDVGGHASPQIGDSYHTTTYNLIVAGTSSNLSSEHSKHRHPKRVVDQQEFGKSLLGKTCEQSENNDSDASQYRPRRTFVEFTVAHTSSIAHVEPTFKQLESLLKDPVKNAQRGHDLCMQHEHAEELSDGFDSLLHASKLLLRLSSITTAIDEQLITDCLASLRKALLHQKYVYTELEDSCITADDVSAALIDAVCLDHLEKARKYLDRTRQIIDSSITVASAEYLSIQRLQALGNKAKEYALLQKAHDVVHEASRQRGPSNVSDEDATASGDERVRPTAMTRRGKFARANNFKENTSTYKIRFPWPASKCFDIAFSFGAGSINFGIQMSTILPEDHPIIAAIWDDDLEALQMELARGNTLQYQTEYGRSLLANALFWFAERIIAFLLKHSAVDHFEAEGTALLDSLFDLFDIDADNPRSNVRGAKCLMLITEGYEDERDILLEDLEQLAASQNEYWAEWPRLWPRVIDKGLSSLPLSWRVNMLEGLDSPWEFRTLLRHGESVEDLFDPDYPQPMGRMLGNIAGGSRQYWPEWTPVVRAFLLELGEFGCFEDDCVGSPLAAIIRVEMSPTCWTQASRRVCCRMRHWLKYLYQIGIDLEEYGRYEKRALEKQSFDCRGVPYYCYSLDYGPHYNDWALSSAPEGIGYEMAATFWSMVESPELTSVPGQFIDDDEEFDMANQAIERYYREWNERKHGLRTGSICGHDQDDESSEEGPAHHTRTHQLTKLKNDQDEEHFEFCNVDDDEEQENGDDNTTTSCKQAE